LLIAGFDDIISHIFGGGGFGGGFGGGLFGNRKFLNTPLKTRHYLLGGEGW